RPGPVWRRACRYLKNPRPVRANLPHRRSGHARARRSFEPVVEARRRELGDRVLVEGAVRGPVCNLVGELERARAASMLELGAVARELPICILAAALEKAGDQPFPFVQVHREPLGQKGVRYRLAPDFGAGAPCKSVSTASSENVDDTVPGRSLFRPAPG